jgi:UrcA family protein
MDQSRSVAGSATTLLACVFGISSAFAGEPGAQVRTEDIKFQDLNLTTTAGVEALYQRVHSAAQRVCADSGQYDLGAASTSMKCTKDAEARAIKEINLPALTLFAENR